MRARMLRLALAALLVTVALAGTAFAADRASGPSVATRDVGSTTTTAAAPSVSVTAAPVAEPPSTVAPVDVGSAARMTVSVDIPCVRPKLQHCDPAHPDAP